MYNKKISDFIRTFVSEIQNSNAGIFAGAGLSQPAGYVDWRELLRDIADELGLDVDKEDDLIAVAQYHVNEHGGRGRLNQVLIENFTKDAQSTRNHEILSQLPIDTYWTTNYDHLIEDSLKAKNKIVDVKMTPQNLAITRPADAIVYKMHGDVQLSDQAVLTKDDYEEYEVKRSLYSQTLRGELISKTFLFIGFSFDDPNLSYILSRIRILLGQDARLHYCFMRKIDREKYSSETEFAYDQVKQELKIKDLQRYKIIVLLVDEYDEITEILETINYLVKTKNIFISGSAIDYGTWGQERAFKFSTNLSKEIIKKSHNIVSGFGLGIGSCIVSGALEELYDSKAKRVEERLKARPFPQATTGRMEISELWTKYRQDMLSNVGIAVFMFGNKKQHDSEKIIDANGMIEEFEISLKNGIVPIPIGATGFTALKLWERVMSDYDKIIGIKSLKPYFEQLGDTKKSDEELLSLTTSLINEIIKAKISEGVGVHGS
ncbi:SIR2 family protein (plasmid) [Bacillus velezensis]|uniref:SIR2 family protein n=1 Tax=Bacillus velezensis TaxID=492670 RepID=UPI000987FE4C|nr:SIR2 family protein [Bacillus velezensis]AQS42438.1 hypothetical protein BVH55_00130 [Bacillus velezensis]WNR83237.1 SIR2 family protein [Bacillus velezensis]